ncbi:CYTH domain-containing protein [Aestuariivirga sp.]|uniref:CYTH and CHAD domain-containing protein n=1 Tax=Aestuariivirga sp. TaxID=2650926 RepID=UPI0039E6496D
MQGIVGERPNSSFASRPDQAAGHPWETEVKFRYDGDVANLQRALNVWPRHRPKQKELRSVYFDTADHDLWKSGITLRLRGDGTPPYRMGIKFAGDTAGGPFRRGEIETEVADAVPQFDSLAPDLVRRLERLRQRKPLVPLFETRITRTVWVVAAGISVVEVVLDEGEIALPDGRSQPLREIELELKDGRDSDLFDLARLMAGRIAVTLEFQSKSDRGFALLHPETRVPRKSTPLLLKRRQTLGDCIDAILSNTLNHFVGNWTALRETDAPESIHQLRVALRRMRSGFKMLRHAFQTEVFETLREEARHIAGGLGPAREIDSFIAAVEAGALQPREKPPGCESSDGSCPRLTRRALSNGPRGDQ